MPWILIIWFASTSSAITTHEFISKEACDNAGKTVATKSGLGYKIDFACVPKDLFHAVRP